MNQYMHPKVIYRNECVKIWTIELDEDCTQFKEVPFLSPFHQQITIFSTLYFSLTIHRLFYFSLLPFVPVLPYMHGQCLSLNPFFLSHSLFTLSCTLLVFISIQSLQFIPFQMFFNRFRFLLCIVSFFALASIYSNQIIINFTFICMTNDVNDTITMSDGVRYSILQLHIYGSPSESQTAI